MILQGLSGQKYEIDTKRLKSGGEGEIYNVIRPSGMIAKIYHSASITNEIEKKLRYMVSNPPQQSVLSQVAWPIDILYDNNLFCGFVMSNLGSYSELWELYSYPPTEHKNITLKHKLIIAHNICSVIAEVHKADYVFGDFNPKNIGVNPDNGKVAFWDVDSYHFSDKNTGVTYRCKVGAPGYIAPELIQKCKPYKNDAFAVAPLDTFTKYTDNFALAIHIFKLLMNGVSPYNGINDSVTTSQASPGRGNDAIERDSYCFKPGKKPQSVLVPPQTILPTKMHSLYSRVFIDGRDHPEKRPTADEWKAAIEEYETKLVQCNNDNKHFYMSGLNSCPWCEADIRYILLTTTPQIQQTNYISPKPIVTPPPSVAPSTNVQRPIYPVQPQINTPAPVSMHFPSVRRNRSYKGLAGIAAAIVVIIIIALSIGHAPSAKPTNSQLESTTPQVVESKVSEIVYPDYIDVPPSYVFDETLSADIVANSAATIRSAPYKESTSLTSLETGVTVGVIGTDNDWFFIEYDGYYGWVSGRVLFANWMWDNGTNASNLNEIYYCNNVFSEPTLVSVTGQVNLRKGPGTDYEVINKIKESETVTVIGQEGEWYFINDNLLYGWIHQDYVPL